MSVKRVKAGPTPAPVAAAALYTVPNVSGKEKAEITQILCNNIDPTNEYTIVLYLVREGDTQGSEDEVYNKTIAAKKDAIPYGLLNANLEAGDAIWTSCATANKINVTLSAREITE